MYPKVLRIATRSSKLSLIQTHIVIEMIRRKYPDINFKIVTLKTIGDKIQDKPLYRIGVKGIFEKEVNIAILQGEADIAVHSLKDLPAQIHNDLTIVGYPPRDSPYDVIVTRRENSPNIYELPRNAIVGTSSLRRKAFLQKLRPDLKIEVIRGNVDTRIKKLLSGNYDAIVIAECGLERFEKIGEFFNINKFRLNEYELPPAPGQGIIAVVTHKKYNDIIKILEDCSDWKTKIEAIAERTFLKVFGGGCHIPLGCLAKVINSKMLKMICGIATLDGSKVKIIEDYTYPENAEELGKQLAYKLKKEALNIIEEIEQLKERKVYV